MKQKTMIIEENKNELPYLAVRSVKEPIKKSIPDKDLNSDWFSMIDALFAHVIFALSCMMLGAVITLQVLAR